MSNLPTRINYSRSANPEKYEAERHSLEAFLGLVEETPLSQIERLRVTDPSAWRALRDKHTQRYQEVVQQIEAAKRRRSRIARLISTLECITILAVCAAGWIVIIEVVAAVIRIGTR